MKKILLGVLLAGTAMSAAQAADLAARRYTKAPVMATVYDWTGFYVGVNAGVGLGRNRAIQDFSGLANASTYVSPQGGLGGAQIGYNWQTNGTFLGPIVFGLEADIQGADMRDSYPNLGGLALLQYNQKLDWFGTVRGRVGLATGPVLTYVTAGYAYGNVNTTVTEGAVASSVGGGRSGWTWGSGVEAALGGNWTGKIEYLWLDLGNSNSSFTLNAIPQTLRSEYRENIFRVGLNYRIGGNSVYTPVASANWAGFYLGGNIGSGTGRDRSSFAAGGAPVLFNTSPDGYNGGVQAGYNWQAGNWVYGLETDIQGSSQEDNKTSTTALGATFKVNSKLPWFGTVRGRIGYSVGSTLFYGTGGLAYGEVKTDSSPLSFSDTRTGWTVGAGIETPFTFLGLFGPNWTTKTEYLYVDLGRATNAFSVGLVSGAYSTDVKEHIFRTGLNYHFNTPVVAKY